MKQKNKNARQSSRELGFCIVVDYVNMGNDLKN